VSIIGACVREAVGAALREHRVGGAIPVAVYHAGQGCPQKPSEGPPFGPDIAAAPGWVEELKLELQSLRAAGPRAALGGQAHGGPKAQAQGTTAADLVRPLPRASLAPSKDAKARDGSPSPARRAAGSSSNSGACQPKTSTPKAPPQRPRLCPRDPRRERLRSPRRRQ